MPRLFFLTNGLKQSARSLLTPVSDTDFYALLHGRLHFASCGRSPAKTVAVDLAEKDRQKNYGQASLSRKFHKL